ncbi:MAG TPA: hypothetical protein VN581_05945, partial [Patescibacteria group bacterium]|nr:hypothetical protein [Patescibacteria group bacterium]
ASGRTTGPQRATGQGVRCELAEASARGTGQAPRRGALARWREQLGEDYAKAKELRGWLAGHAKGKELLAYLFLSQTEGA